MRQPRVGNVFLAPRRQGQKNVPIFSHERGLVRRAKPDQICERADRPSGWSASKHRRHWSQNRQIRFTPFCCGTNCNRCPRHSGQVSRSSPLVMMSYAQLGSLSSTSSTTDAGSSSNKARPASCSLCFTWDFMVVLRPLLFWRVFRLGIRFGTLHHMLMLVHMSFV